VTAKATARQRKPAETDNDLQHYTIEQAAKLLGVSKRWLDYRIASGDIKPRQPEGSTIRRLRADDIRDISDSWLVDPTKRGRRPTTAEGLAKSA
jgi:excisionase family DNA binding protein